MSLITQGLARGHLWVDDVHGRIRAAAIVRWDWRESANRALLELFEQNAGSLRRFRVDLAALKEESPEELAALLENARELPDLEELFLGHPLDEQRMSEACERRFRALFPRLPDSALERRYPRVALIRMDGQKSQATPVPVHLRAPMSDDQRVSEEFFVFIDDTIYVRCPVAQSVGFAQGRTVAVEQNGVLALRAGDRVQFAARTPPGFGHTYQVVGPPEGNTDEPPWRDAWIPPSKRKGPPKRP